MVGCLPERQTAPNFGECEPPAYRADVNGGAADATAGRFLIFFFAGTAGIV